MGSPVEGVEGVVRADWHSRRGERCMPEAREPPGALALTLAQRRPCDARLLPRRDSEKRPARQHRINECAIALAAALTSAI
eukprot:4341519-Pleurochrysis_carterae.AAC.4